MTKVARRDRAKFGAGLRLAFPGFLLGLVTMAITVMAYHPVAFAPFIFLGPALFLVFLARRNEAGFWSTWWGGMFAWGYGLLAWIGSVTGAPEAGLVGALIVSGIFLLMSWPFGALMRRGLRAGSPLVIAAPLVMTAFAAFRRLSSQGLAWHDVGYALADWNTIIQVADLASVYPLDLFVWAANGLLADLVLARLKQRARSPREARLAPALLAIMLAALLGYGHLRRAAIEKELRPGPLIAGLQTGIPQAEKMKSELSPLERRHRIALDLMNEARARAPDIDLVVWPETSFFPIDDSTRSEPRGVPFDLWLNSRRRVSGTSVAEEFASCFGDRFAETKFVIGAIQRDDMPPGLYDEGGLGVRERNAVFLLAGDLVDERPHLAPSARADKIKLVPFGEYIPFPAWRLGREKLKSFVRATAGYLPAMTAGDEVAVWDLDFEGESLPVTVNVCYESVFPEIFRSGRRRGAAFALNVSNDSWYDESAERDLVHAQIKFRAIENRFSIVRVSNTGISVSMDPLGRERALVGRDKRAILVDRPPLGIAPPPAVWLSLMVEWSLIALAILFAFLPRLRKFFAEARLRHSMNP